jgi:sodium-dependent dicarboxylate transporter 2/3/5
VPSRTARTALLLPTVAIPLATAGADLTLLALISVQGSGFCQSWAVGAKPIAVFARAGDSPPFTPADLWRLSAWMAPAMVASLMLFAIGVWPSMGI